jgi:hypothetical protein
MSSFSCFDPRDITHEFAPRELLFREHPPDDKHPFEHDEEEKCSSDKEGDESTFGRVERGEHEVSIVEKREREKYFAESRLERVVFLFHPLLINRVREISSPHYFYKLS